MDHLYDSKAEEFNALLCKLCGGVDNGETCSLTSECQGYPLTFPQWLAVRAGAIDFINGVWTIKPVRVRQWTRKQA